jgi:hypothetical protein
MRTFIHTSKQPIARFFSTPVKPQDAPIAVGEIHLARL